MNILLQKEWKYTLYINQLGMHILTVICGTIGLYEAEHALTNEELNRYQTEGKPFIDSLANDISLKPNA